MNITRIDDDSDDDEREKRDINHTGTGGGSHNKENCVSTSLILQDSLEWDEPKSIKHSYIDS